MIRVPGLRVAVLLTVHDRRETTLACLEALFACPSDMHVVLVDDGCTDGTAAAVRARFPAVEVLTGDGSLYWSGGMRLAIGHVLARPGEFDYHLWLNDDTTLDPDAVNRLLACHRDLALRGRGRSIVVGSTRHPDTGEVTYGGIRRIPLLPFLRRVRPGERPRPCSTMNGNCVLVPDDVARSLGNLHPGLTHLRGDIEFGHRARRRGVGVWLAPGSHGVCGPNLIGGWRDATRPLAARLASLSDPKYCLREKILVERRYYGPLWFLSPLAVFTWIGVTHVLARVTPRRSRPVQRSG